MKKSIIYICTSAGIKLLCVLIYSKHALEARAEGEEKENKTSTSAFAGLKAAPFKLQSNCRTVRNGIQLFRFPWKKVQKNALPFYKAQNTPVFLSREMTTQHKVDFPRCCLRKNIF